MAEYEENIKNNELLNAVYVNPAIQTGNLVRTQLIRFLRNNKDLFLIKITKKKLILNNNINNIFYSILGAE